MKFRMTLTAVASLLLLAISAPARGDQSGPCSNATVRGTYGFTVTGQILGAGPVTGVTLAIYDGQGHMTQVDHVLLNGNPPTVQWRPATGTYTLNADCTGTQEVDFSDGTPSLHLSIVVVGRGREIHQVVDDPGIATIAVGIKRDSPL